jgi:putative ABC transport system ATP-binding protein
MMHEGKIVIDKEGAEKDNINVDDVLKKFTEISIECGN